jgi:hypothetical protein
MARYGRLEFGLVFDLVEQRDHLELFADDVVLRRQETQVDQGLS